MNPRFTPPSRTGGRSGRAGESLSIESPASQTRRKLAELAVELGAPSAAKTHGAEATTSHLA